MTETLLRQLPKKARREIQRKATELYRAGIEPSAEEVTPVTRRFQQRQVARALGWRGSKAKRKKTLAKRLHEVKQVLIVDEALQNARARSEHPVRARLQGR